MNGAQHLQLVAILPDVIQAHDVGMIQQLHDADLALQSKGNDFAVGAHGRVFFSALYEVGQAQSPHLLRRGLRDDLRCAILSRPTVAHEPYARAAATPNGPTQLPWAYGCLSPAVGGGCIRAGGRDLRVTLGAVRARLVGDDGRQTLVLGRRLFLPHCQGAIGDYGLVVGQRVGRRGRQAALAVVLAASPLCRRVLIRTRGGFSKGSSTGGRPAMVAVVHVVQKAVVACSDRGGGSSMLVQCVA